MKIFTCLFQEAETPDHLDDQERGQDGRGNCVEFPEDAAGSVEVEAASGPVRSEFEDDEENEAGQEGDEERDIQECSAFGTGQHLSSLSHPDSIHPHRIPIPEKPTSNEQESKKQDNSNRDLSGRIVIVGEHADRKGQDNHQAGNRNADVHSFGATLDEN